MIGNGANQTAKTALETYLGKSMSTFNSDAKEMVNRKDNVLSLANNIWYINGLTPNSDFKKTVADYYNAGMQPAPMNNNTVDEINAWADKNTDHMIPKILKYGDLSPANRTVVANAMLFDAKWTEPFKDSAVQDDDFTLFNSKKKKVKMMYSKEDTYYENEYATAFEKTYGDGKEYSFIGILPKKKGKFNLSELDIAGLLKNKKKEDVYISLPKFTYDWEDKLSDALKETSLAPIYGRNFDKIVNEEILWVDSIIQGCKIIVDEKGTKAAAVTVATMKSTGISINRKEVKLDRPFAYVIKDNKTGSVLFVGKCIEP